jgi:hypothetical protein
MGLFDDLFHQPQNTIQQSILPVAAKQEILNGRLPHINTSNIILRNGEFCCYIDKAILNIYRTKRYYDHIGGSRKGLFGDYRVNYGRGIPREYNVTDQQKGFLYLTNKRLIFLAQKNAFEKKHISLTSIETYSNAVVLQYGSKTYTLIVADGEVVNRVIQLSI